MLAVRSNERAAAAAGINVRNVKLAAFGISSFIAGISGALYGYNFSSVTVNRFSALTALSLIALAYVGGITMVSGAIFAGLISVEALFPYALEKWLDISGNYALLFAGLALIVTLIQNPDGVAGATYRKHQLRSRRRAAERAARPVAAGGHMTDRILTTHAGSLLQRPPECWSSALHGERALRSSAGRAVADVVRRQVEAGIDVVDDGEYGKSIWSRTSPSGWEASSSGRISAGLDASCRRAATTWRSRTSMRDDAETPDVDLLQATRPGVGAAIATRLWFCVGPITYDPPPLQRDIARFRRRRSTRVDVADAFMPVVAPASASLLASERALRDPGGAPLGARRRAPRGVRGDRRCGVPRSRSTTPC